jgi:hypothetical protein
LSSRRAAKHLIEYKGHAAARTVIAEARSTAHDPEALAIELTRRVHISYQDSIPQINAPILWRLRPYLTNEVLPEILRIQAGAIDVIYIAGQCDSAARTLQFLLAEANLPAEQFNIVRRYNGGHSVTLVELSSERAVMLDALFGVVPKQDGTLLTPMEAQKLVRQGGPTENIWTKLMPTSDISFYSQFGDAVFAKQGAGLDIETLVSFEGGEPIVLGNPDGKSNDVIHDGPLHGFTSYWDYIGHRYDRGWRLIIKVAQDTRMTIGLVEPLNEKFITTKLNPTIQGKELIYEIAAGDSLFFYDGIARRDWIRLRSNQDVDYIRFEPL